MRKIYKYQLDNTDHQILELPLGYKILSVQEQNNRICMWVLVDIEEKNNEEVAIWIFGTGHEMTNTLDIQFLGTVQLAKGNLVFHIFKDK